MTSKRLLFLIRRPPAETRTVVETLQSAIVAAVLGQQVTLLFRDDGVLQLSRDSELGTEFQQSLQTLPEYDINEIFACEASLKQRTVLDETLAVSVTRLTHREQATLIQQQDVVISDA